MSKVRLDADIRAVAEQAQLRRREATKRVAAGEIMHMRFMGREALREAMGKNAMQVVHDDRPLQSLADVVNYGLALIADAPKEEAE